MKKRNRQNNTPHSWQEIQKKPPTTATLSPPRIFPLIFPWKRGHKSLKMFHFIRFLKNKTEYPNKKPLQFFLVCAGLLLYLNLSNSLLLFTFSNTLDSCAADIIWLKKSDHKCSNWFVWWPPHPHNAWHQHKPLIINYFNDSVSRGIGLQLADSTFGMV